MKMFITVQPIFKFFFPGLDSSIEKKNNVIVSIKNRNKKKEEEKKTIGLMYKVD